MKTSHRERNQLRTDGRVGSKLRLRLMLMLWSGVGEDWVRSDGVLESMRRSEKKHQALHAKHDEIVIAGYGIRRAPRD